MGVIQLKVTFNWQTVQSGAGPGYTTTMPTNANPRKLVAAHVASRLAAEAPEGMTIAPDATNPYAMVVEVDGKRFRVIVKEIA